MFNYKTTIKIYDVDAAGVLFFANQFKLVYDAYEAYLEELGFSVKRIINESNFLLPIVSAKTEFLSPLFVGDTVNINIKIKKTGKNSIILSHKIYKDSGTLVGKGETIHVSIDKLTRKKIPFPEDLSKLFQNSR